MPTERRRVYYAGRVQGVGFRFTAQRLAEGLGVSGYVRNLADGRVELVAESESATLDLLAEAIMGEMGNKVRSASSTDEPPGEAFNGFSIRY